jgi:lipid-binding SYLF domain-containing protein
MKGKLLVKATLLSLAVPLLPLTNTFAEDRALDRSSSSFKEAERSLQRSTEVYKAISESPKQKVPASVLRSAKCVAIFPDTRTVSLGVGGTHSDGVGFCKTAQGTWENPMFLNLTGGSVGLQAGYKSADMVMFITGDKAQDALRRGEFRVGGELSAVAGSFDRTFEPRQAEVVVYRRTEGLFAGASVDGVSITRDEDDENAFYGARKPSLTASIPSDLERRVNEIKEVLPTAVG